MSDTVSPDQIARGLQKVFRLPEGDLPTTLNREILYKLPFTLNKCAFSRAKCPALALVLNVHSDLLRLYKGYNETESDNGVVIIPDSIGTAANDLVAVQVFVNDFETARSAASDWLKCTHESKAPVVYAYGERGKYAAVAIKLTSFTNG
jgi:hypothetical protein